MQKVRLDFRDPGELQDGDPIPENLSAVELTGDVLWLASDETAALERLQRLGPDRFGAHRRIDLARLFDLPAGPGGEMDIEGLAADDGWLWIVGSHSLARVKPKRADDPQKALDRLETVRRDPNRYFLGRAPLVEGPDGLQIAAKAPDGRRAGCLRMRKDGGNKLMALLAQDPHLAAFMGIPAKDNGFDIEGLAAAGSRLFLGLRGPVLRGWATLIELNLRPTRNGRLKLDDVDGHGARWRSHFLDLDGLGIRELVRDGDDLLILAGPTLDLDGPVRIYRWPGALSAGDRRVVPGQELARLVDLPLIEGSDHAEGLVLVPDGGVLIVYDNPGPGRMLDGGRAAFADILDLPPRAV